MSPVLAPRMARALAVLVLVAFSPAARAEGTVKLRDLVAEALRRQPALARSRQAARAAAQVASRVGSMPDPRLEVAAQNLRVDDPQLSGSPMSAIELALMQGIPFPGKLGRRAAVAHAGAGVAERDVDLVAASTALRVRRDYWRLHFAEAALAITIETDKVLETLSTAVDARLSVGQAAQQDALQAEVAHSRVRALLEERRQAVTSARRELNAAVGRPPTDTLLPTEAPPPVAPLDRAALVGTMRASNPALRLSRARLAVADRALADAKYERWPDFDLGAGYRFRAVVPGDPTNGADMFGVTVGMTLPVWMGSKQNARVRETLAARDAAEAGVDATELDAQAELERTIDMIERLGRELALYDRELLKEADQALDASISDYEVGRIGFVSVLQNWQAYLEVRLARVRLATERAEHLAELRALIGEEADQ